MVLEDSVFQVVFKTIIKTLLPGGEDLPSAAEVCSDQRALEILDRLPSYVRHLLKITSFFLNNGARLYGKGAFVKLDPANREKIILLLERRFPLAARALLPLKLLAVSAYLENPRVMQKLETGLENKNAQDQSQTQLINQKTNQRTATPDSLPVFCGGAQTKSLQESFDVVVIGSGAGGAPVARELSRAGWSVALVEEGSAVRSLDMKALPLDRVKKFYRNHGATATLGKPMILLPLGKAVGGTTVINSGTCFRTPDSVIAEWRKKFGIKWTPEELFPFYEDVEKTLGVTTPGWDVLGGNAATMRDGANNLGLASRPLLRNVSGCCGCGECALGCPSDGKKAVHLNYLPQAVEAGAQIFSESRVDRILIKNRKAVGVCGTFVSATNNVTGEKTGVSFQLNARRGVVVCGGAVLTPGILRSSGLQHRGQGCGLRLHPCTAVTALFDRDIFAWRGVMQSYLVDTLKDEGIMLEATFPPPALGYVEGSFALSGLERQNMIAHLKNIASIGILISDSSRGKVRSIQFGGMPLMTYFLNHADKVKMLKGMEMASQILFAAGAREIYPMIQGVQRIRNSDEAKRCFSKDWPASALGLTAYHPMGTVRMGADIFGPLDENGYYKEIERLAVADASVFPTSLSVNPQVTIMAVATRTAQKILESW